MRVHFTVTSPYARKVMVAVQELGLQDRVECVVTMPSTSSGLAQINPLGKIPVLELDDGAILYDSPVIVDYLDDLAGRKLTPASGPARWQALALQALGDGMMDALVAVLMESRRPDGEKSAGFMDQQRTKVRQALEALEAKAAGFGPLATVGEITILAALGYLEFRFPDITWRSAQPTLAAWFDRVSLRPSAAQTKPQ